MSSNYDYFDEELEQPHQDAPQQNDLPVKKIHIKRLSDDKVFIEIKRDVPMHWTEQKKLGYKPKVFEKWDFADNDKSDPDNNWTED